MVLRIKIFTFKIELGKTLSYCHYLCSCNELYLVAQLPCTLLACRSHQLTHNEFHHVSIRLYSNNAHHRY